MPEIGWLEWRTGNNANLAITLTTSVVMNTRYAHQIITRHTTLAEYGHGALTIINVEDNSGLLARSEHSLLYGCIRPCKRKAFFPNNQPRPCRRLCAGIF